MKANVGKWRVEALEDKDGHLTLALSHRDGTRVVCCDADISANDTEWSDRFTTDGIEEAYVMNELNPA